MRGALPFLMFLFLVFGEPACCHRDPLQAKAAQAGIPPDEHKRMMRDSPLYRSIMESPGYQAETRLLLQRIQKRVTPQELLDWAHSVLEEHKSDGSFYLLASNDVPRFVREIDPPLQPSVYVFPPSNVTIAWVGGFETRGIFVGGTNAPVNPVIYAIEWVPGIYVYHDLQ